MPAATEEAVATDVNKVETVAETGVDHGIALAKVVETELETAKSGLDSLRQHSAATSAGSTVSNAILAFSSFIEKVEAALGIHKAAAAQAVVAQNAANEEKRQALSGTGIGADPAATAVQPNGGWKV